MSEPLPKLEYSLLCDDVRREDSGKFIVIGLYGDNILVQSFPALLQLSLLVSVRSQSAGDVPFLLEAMLADQEVYVGEGTLRFEEPGSRAMARFGNIIISAASAGPLVIRCKFGRGKKQVMNRLMIAARQD